MNLLHSTHCFYTCILLNFFRETGLKKMSEETDEIAQAAAKQKVHQRLEHTTEEDWNSG